MIQNAQASSIPNTQVKMTLGVIGDLTSHMHRCRAICPAPANVGINERWAGHDAVCTKRTRTGDRLQ
jgi:hypothetical protein